MFLKVIYVVACVSASFLFELNSIPLDRCAIFCLSVHQWMSTWSVSTLGLLWIILIWIFMYKFLCGHWSLFLLDITRSGISGLYGNSAFNILGAAKVVFQGGCAILRFYQQCIRALISPHPHHHLLSFCIIFILVDVK